MRLPTIVKLFVSWSLCCIENNIGSVNAGTAMSRYSNLLAVRSSLTKKDKSTLFVGSKASSNLSFLRTTTSLALLNTRGGADDSDDEEDSSEDYDEYDEESEYEDDEDMFSHLDMDDVDDADDFKQDSTVDRLIEEYHRTPPATKAYLTASFAATALGYVTCNNEFPPILALDWNKVIRGGQIWRPFTAFLNLGSFSLLGYPMTVQFMHQYMSFLERLEHKKPYDFWVMIFFGMTSMLAGYGAMKLSPRFLGHNLSTFLVYIWSRMFEGAEVGIFNVITIKAELLPWFMVAQVRHR